MAVEDWKDEYQHVIGDVLGWINARSYEAHGVLLSAMAMNKQTNQPGDQFYGLSQTVGLFNGKTDAEKSKFWMEQINGVIAHEFTKSLPVLRKWGSFPYRSTTPVRISRSDLPCDGPRQRRR